MKLKCDLVVIFAGWSRKVKVGDLKENFEEVGSKWKVEISEISASDQSQPTRSESLNLTRELIRQNND